MTGPHTALVESIPLCVDLDGTLISGDLLYESFLIAVKKQPLTAFACIGWLLKGKAVLKAELAARAEIDYQTLPYNQPLLDYLRQEKKEGRSLVLATASDAKFAHGIASHLDLFDHVFSSCDGINMEGRTKRKTLEQVFASTGYAYIGNSHQDFPVWEGAASRLAANAAPSVLHRLGKLGPIEQVFGGKGSILDYLRAIRVHQWLKNLLIFIPLIAAHKGLDFALFQKVGIAFAAFSLVASSVYLLNDLVDLDHDRKHPRKKKRPLASGRIQIPTAGALIVALMATSVALCLFLPPAYQITLLCYYGITFLYSFWLKRMLLVDVITLAGLYTIRLVAGSAATSIPLSVWLLTFSGFLFLSLALVKRYTELREAVDANRGDPSGRGYQLADVNPCAMLGAASGMVSILVVALYVSSPEVQALYRAPKLLLLLCPVILYWLARVWILAGRKQIHDDPIVFAMRDRASYILGLVAMLIIIAATLLDVR